MLQPKTSLPIRPPSSLQSRIFRARLPRAFCPRPAQANDPGWGSVALDQGHPVLIGERLFTNISESHILSKCAPAEGISEGREGPLA